MKMVLKYQIGHSIIIVCTEKEATTVLVNSEILAKNKRALISPSIVLLPTNEFSSAV